MMKVLIVDDEVLERKALTKIMNRSSEDVRVIGEAPNGRKAIEMALKYRPDIIFMDIKMPGIDGVKAVKEIKKIDPSIRFIMVSAFNTFEYAKEVMQQGVREYILKPSSQKDILASLQRVVSDILEERKQKEEQKSLRENLDRAVSIAQKEWVSSLLLNQVQDLTFEEWGQLLGEEITSGWMMIFSLKLSAETDISPNELQRWNVWLKDALKTNVNHYETMVGPLGEYQVPILFLCKRITGKNHYKADALSIIEHIQSEFYKSGFNGDLKVGVGHPYHHAYELTKSYHEAAAALRQLEKTANRKILFCTKDALAVPVSGSSVLEVEKQLLDTVRQGETKQVLSAFDVFVSRLDDGNPNEQLIKRSFDELFVLLHRMLHDLGIHYEEKFRVEDMDNSEEIIMKGKAYLLSIVHHVQVWRNNHAKGMLYKAKEYIENHFAEALTLESVAEYVELSPYYFSKLFKDRFGMTFIDYLTNVRIQHAKVAMLDPRRSLKEICYSIGYKDPNYFSRVFKKHTGVSPTEFRKVP
ncbi:response regulator [Bacillota bacterium Lsc_1132]